MYMCMLRQINLKYPGADTETETNINWIISNVTSYLQLVFPIQLTD